MAISEYKAELLKNYRSRDIDAIIRTTKGLMQDREFPNLYNQLFKQNRVSSASVNLEEIISALLTEIEQTEQEEHSSGDEFASVTYYEISAELGKQFGEDLAELYMNTKMPDEFLVQVRSGYSESNKEKLSEDMVNRYRKEMILIDSGRKTATDVLQKFSHFPVQNATTMSRLMGRLVHDLRSNYKYLTVKPYLMAVYANGQTAGPQYTPIPDIHNERLVLFKHYLNTSEEPTVIQQVKFRLAINTLFRHIKQHEVLPEDEFKAYVKIISRIWGYRCPSKLTPNARDVLEELLLLVNQDQLAILKRLAQTFVEEYRQAEDRMKMFHNGIQSELAITKEYLNQLSREVGRINSEEEEKIKVAQEKMIGLDGVFDVSPAMGRAAMAKSFLELERTSLGLSTSVTPERLTEWIRIYSILYSNTEFLEYTEEEVDFSTMRKYISDLSTYHLILNIAQLKAVIDRSLSIPEEDKHSHFKMFNEALKKRLHNLLGGNEEEKTLADLIGELGFLENKSLQFVIAETFEGFQVISDAFTGSATDYFVNDREALLRESRGLYKQICNQCLKNFVIRPIRHEQRPGKANTTRQKSWLTRLFS